MIFEQHLAIFWQSPNQNHDHFKISRTKSGLGESIVFTKNDEHYPAIVDKGLVSST